VTTISDYADALVHKNITERETHGSSAPSPSRSKHSCGEFCTGEIVEYRRANQPRLHHSPAPAVGRPVTAAALDVN
jgi:hypothetical protein